MGTKAITLFCFLFLFIKEIKSLSIRRAVIHTGQIESGINPSDLV